MAKTVQEVRDHFRACGWTVKAWADEHGFPLRAVQAVLYGHNKGHRGQSHRIAVALGIKDEQK